MKKIISWIFTIPFFVVFGLLLLIFHPIQVIAFNIFGYNAHKRSIDYLNISIICALFLTGMRYKFAGSKKKLPLDRPLIIVSNHQSIFDIPFLIWSMRRHHPKFVAKKELGKGLPSVSYHLKYGGNVMINRDDKDQALEAIEKLGKYIEQNKRSAIIFPEGKRAKNGQMKVFKAAGLLQLMESAPSALVVPVAIQDSSKLAKYGFKPIPFGVKCSMTVLEPIEPSEYINKVSVVEEAEQRIRKMLGQEAHPA